MNHRTVAVHLPQYHPIPENDKWWGKGFTEWTNVAKSNPRFANHYQPHLPADLGFYDLRLPQTLNDQAALAKDHGIFGFMFYHYWFSGKRVLEKPIENYFEDKAIDFPFMLCWANENWTRRWDGRENDILLSQEYSAEDDKRHFKTLLPYFLDDRYIRINDKPVFVIYRTELFPDIVKTTEIWRQEALKSGVGDLYLIRVESFKSGVIPADIGFDASMEFQPNWASLPKRYLPGKGKRAVDKLLGRKRFYLKDKIYSYSDLIENSLSSPRASYLKYPTVTPMWDNSARRAENATIFTGSSPSLYEYWLKESISRFESPTPEENLVFINAWNEWAEGNHLEPCQKWGRAYLEATKRACGS